MVAAFCAFATETIKPSHIAAINFVVMGMLQGKRLGDSAHV